MSDLRTIKEQIRLDLLKPVVANKIELIKERCKQLFDENIFWVDFSNDFILMNSTVSIPTIKESFFELLEAVYLAIPESDRICIDSCGYVRNLVRNEINPSLIGVKRDFVKTLDGVEYTFYLSLNISHSIAIDSGLGVTANLPEREYLLIDMGATAAKEEQKCTTIDLMRQLIEFFFVHTSDEKIIETIESLSKQSI